MPGYGDLFDKLAEAYARPSGAYRAATAALDVPNQALEGYLQGTEIGDAVRKRKMGQKLLGDVLGNGLNGLTVNEAEALAKPAEAYAAIEKAQNYGTTHKGTQLFALRGNKGLVFNPNETSISEIPIPPSEGDQPIVPKAVTPTLSPYVDPGGQPLTFTPGRGLTPTPSVGGTPVLKQGNEQAVADVALMKTQTPLIDTIFDAYKNMGAVRSKFQATPAGYVLDPVAKQAENALKLSAFTFGGKNLTTNEKNIVFGAFFPNAFDNPVSRENKRALLKDYFSGKIDLLQAANLLGPAAAPLKAMLQSKVQQPPPPFGNRQAPTFANEQDAEASGYKGPAVIAGRRAVIH